MRFQESLAKACVLAILTSASIGSVAGAPEVRAPLAPSAPHSGASSPNASPYLTEEQNQLMGILGMFLTIVAFGISIWQSKLAIGQNQDAERQAERLGQIANALSTKYIGPYPEYVARIPEVLVHANHVIRILCSVPIHGIFNNADSWLKSKQAIEAFLAKDGEDRQVRCIFATRQERDKLQRNQYKSLAKNWDAWKNDPDNRRKIISLVSRVSPKDPNSGDTFDGFLSLLERASVRELATTFDRAVICEIEYSPPMFLWIIDDKEAIFVLKTTYPEFRAEAFWTSDARLVESLIKIHESYILSSALSNQQSNQGGM